MGAIALCVVIHQFHFRRSVCRSTRHLQKDAALMNATVPTPVYHDSYHNLSTL